MNPVHTLQGLIEQIGPRLKLRWLTPRPSRSLPLRDDDRGVDGQSLVGSLNCIHPNRIQVIGHAELVYLADLGQTAYQETIEKLFAARPAAVIFAEDIEPEAPVYTRAERADTPLLSSPLSDGEIIGHLQYFLTHALAERTTVHGVFMEVLGMGLDLGLVVQVVAEKDHASIAGGLVGGLAEAIGAEVAVEEVEVEVWAELLQLEGVLDRLGAADAGAIGSVGLAGADALDHDHGAGGGQGAVGDLELELALGEDAGVLAVEVVGGGGR
ncbi:MAG: hypothetical protein P8Y25_13570 [Chromatiaceae bacterium]